MKKIITVIVFVIFGYSLQAQQQGQYSQYMMNYFLVNPAVAGTEDLIDVRVGYRTQWVGLSGAPRNYYVSGHMPLNKVHSRMANKRKKPEAYHVAGGIFSGQRLGALTHTTGYVSYAYHLPLTMDWIMSMGAIAGINQYSLDQNALDFGDNVGDPAAGGINKTKFDMGLGIWIYSDRIFLGISSQQILQSKLNFSESTAGQGLLNRHYYLTAGCKLQLNDEIRVIPSVFIKNTTTALQFDINTKIRYKEILWGGVSYRKTDAFVLLAGMGIPLGNSDQKGGYSRLEIGYSYDVVTSGLRPFNGGSHEIMASLILPMKGRVLCPSNYW